MTQTIADMILTLETARKLGMIVDEFTVSEHSGYLTIYAVLEYTPTQHTTEVLKSTLRSLAEKGDR